VSPLHTLLCVANIEQASIDWFTPICEPVPLFKSGVFVDCMVATCSRAASRWHGIAAKDYALEAEYNKEKEELYYIGFIK